MGARVKVNRLAGLSIVTATLALALVAPVPAIAYVRYGPAWGWYGPYWGPRWGWPGPWYGYPAYPAYAVPAYPYPYGVPAPPPPPPVVQPAPPFFWYYCGPAQAYYPYVEQCAEGWTRIVPPAPPAPPARSGG